MTNQFKRWTAKTNLKRRNAKSLRGRASAKTRRLGKNAWKHAKYALQVFWPSEKNKKTVETFTF